MNVYKGHNGHLQVQQGSVVNKDLGPKANTHDIKVKNWNIRRIKPKYDALFSGLLITIRSILSTLEIVTARA